MTREWKNGPKNLKGKNGGGGGEGIWQIVKDANLTTSINFVT